jgi:hypothetical protein
VILALSLVVGSVLAMGSRVQASPFADVPDDHWAYGYIQTLADDGLIEGYPDGYFKGDRPLTRYELSTIVARALAKLQSENHDEIAKLASKGDIDKLSQLVFSLKDELDGQGVRVAALEEALAQLDEHTKTAQALQVHAEMLSNGAVHSWTTTPHTIVNGTAAGVPLAYGATAQSGAAAPADPFVTTYLASNETNLPFVDQFPGVQLREDDHFVLSYAISDSLALSLPIRVVNTEFGNSLGAAQQVDVSPSLSVDLSQSGIISNFHVTFGDLDLMPSSRTGLAFRAPFGDRAGDPYADPFGTPLQPTQRGISVAGTVLGLTDFSASFSRIDPVLLNTQSVVDVAGANQTTGYLSPIIPPQIGLVQTGAAQSTQTISSDSFAAVNGPLTQVSLSRVAVLGTVYVSSYNGSTFNASGALVTQGPGGPTSPPGFQFSQAYNMVIFTSPLAVGSHITLTYTGVDVASNTNFQRYMINARVNQKLKEYPGAEVGFTFNRIFDYDGSTMPGAINGDITQPVIGTGAVSDTVFGLDFQMPLGARVAGDAATPILYAEGALSNFTPDFLTVPATTDTAGVVGTRFHIHSIGFDLRYQNVGPNYLDGAPYSYFGNAPSTFSAYSGAYVPDFFGFANTLQINRQFDQQFAGTGVISQTALNPNLTFAYPVFNPFRGVGPTFYQAFVPNSRGLTADVTAPIHIGHSALQTRLEYQHLSDIQPSSQANALSGASYPTTVHLTDDSYALRTSLALHAFGKPVDLDLDGAFETLERNDTTAFPYYPFNPSTQGPDPASVAAAAALPGGNSGVTFVPNYIDMHHVSLGAGATLPISQDIGIGVHYSTQRFNGSYGTTLAPNITERKEYLSGNVSYHIPHSNSTLDFQTTAARYSDPNVPSYDFNQTQQNLNLTVRF